MEVSGMAADGRGQGSSLTEPDNRPDTPLLHHGQSYKADDRPITAASSVLEAGSIQRGGPRDEEVEDRLLLHHRHTSLLRPAREFDEPTERCPLREDEEKEEYASGRSCYGDAPLHRGETGISRAAADLRRWAMAPQTKAWLFGDRQTWQDWGISLWSEFLGTFLMVFVGVGVGVRLGTTKEENAFAFFMVIIFIVESFVPFSGAHFNPVVSLVMFLSGVTNACLFVLHTLVQCLASTLAAYLMLLLLPEARENNCGVNTVTPAWHDPIGIWRAICLEAVMTGTLIYVILTTGLHSKSKERNALSTLAVACTVGTLILLGGDLTGTSLNPARSLGPAIACGYWQYQWISFVGPPAGSVVAWMAYTLTHHKS